MPTAGIFAARAAYIAGFDGTSDVEAGRRFAMPVYGTMAHSFVMVFDSEAEAFRAFAQTFPQNAMLLIDTYDTLECARTVARLAKKGLPVKGVRLDSGDIPSQALAVRKILDQAGLQQVQIFVSSGVDEYSIDAWLAANLPIDAFGVGTHFITSSDAPYLDMAYKLTEYNGQPKIKTSPGKVTFPYKRQVLRCCRDGEMDHDETVRIGEEKSGEPLVQLIMDQGELTAPLPKTEQIRQTCRQDLEQLPPSLRQLAKSEYPVIIN